MRTPRIILGVFFCLVFCIKRNKDMSFTDWLWLQAFDLGLLIAVIVAVVVAWYIAEEASRR